MKCNEIQTLLLGASPRELSPAEHADLTRHLDTCASCRHALDRFHELDQHIYNHIASSRVQGMERARKSLHAQSQHPITRLFLALGGLPRWHYASAIPAFGGLAILVLLIVVIGAARPSADTQTTGRPAGSSNITTSQQGTGQDRVWFITSSPEPDTMLTGMVPFELAIGYQLVSAPQAILSIKLANEAGGQTRYFIEPVRVGGGQEATVRFLLDAERARALLGRGPIFIEATLRAADSSEENNLLTTTTLTNARYQLR